jgi:hypothetical protein
MSFSHYRPIDLYKHVIDKCDFTINNFICGNKPVEYSHMKESKSIISRCKDHINHTPTEAIKISFGEHAYEEALVWEVMQS